MFNSTYRRFYMAQKTCKRNYDKNVTRRKTFKVGDYVFVNIFPTESKTVKQKQQNEANSKLLTCKHGPFEVVQVFENVILVLEDDFKVQINVDLCTLSQNPRTEPQNSNSDQADNEVRFVHYSTDTMDMAPTFHRHGEYGSRKPTPRRRRPPRNGRSGTSLHSNRIPSFAREWTS